MRLFSEYCQAYKENELLLDSGVELVPYRDLEIRFGYYACSQCNNGWTSGWTWTVPYIEEAYYGQDCQECKLDCQQNGFIYRGGELAYKVSHKLRATGGGDRDDDIKMPHVQELCQYCCNLPLSCAQIYMYAKKHAQMKNIVG